MGPVEEGRVIPSPAYAVIWEEGTMITSGGLFCFSFVSWFGGSVGHREG